MTLTQDNDMAAAAKTGERRIPANGYRIPEKIPLRIKSQL